MKTLHIVEIETGLDAHVIRLAAEAWGASVTVTWVGNSRQVVDFFGGGPGHDLIVISAHGDERGLLLPELDPSVAKQFPYDRVITPSDFGDFLSLRGNVVINASCMGGMRALADVFLAKGASHFIGPVDYPDAADALMYVLEFMYRFLVRGDTVADAHRNASAHDDDRRHFVLYSK